VGIFLRRAVAGRAGQRRIKMAQGFRPGAILSLFLGGGVGSVGDAYVGDIDAEGGGEGDLVVLLLEEDLADLFGGGELA
jgi:hypothetical protein